ncbi:MAG: histone deacetylase [Betaproteobacteria bacterium]
MRVGYFDHPLFDAHDAGPGHPERPERLAALRRGLRQAGLDRELVACEPRPATPEELRRVHAPGHVESLARTAGVGGRFDPDTAAGPRTYEAALLAAGAVAEAVTRVLDGRLERAFCAVRPPGHHATADRAMGFCYLNNVAVGAAAALAHGLERVALIDIDVHHGNGTQEIFWDDRRVLYVSSHQFPFYPGTGALHEDGGGEGRGFTVNLPLPAGCGDGEYASVYREIVLPIGRAFDPQLVLVSAGFDASRGDPLAGMDLTPDAFGELMDVCLAAAAGAAGGRLVAVFEGGYDLDAVAAAAAAVVGRMLDHPRAGLVARPRAGAERLLAAYRAAHARHWPQLGPA